MQQQLLSKLNRRNFDTSRRTPPFSTTGSGTRQGLVDFIGSGSRQGFRGPYESNEKLDAFRYEPRGIHKINKPSSLSLGLRLVRVLRKP